MKLLILLSVLGLASVCRGIAISTNIAVTTLVNADNSVTLDVGNAAAITIPANVITYATTFIPWVAGLITAAQVAGTNTPINVPISYDTTTKIATFTINGVAYPLDAAFFTSFKSLKSVIKPAFSSAIPQNACKTASG